VSFQDLKDVFEIRLFLVGLSGRFAGERITTEELTNLKELLVDIKREKNRKELIRLDAEFHNVINDSIKNKTLALTLERLRNQIGRLWFFAKENDRYPSQIPKNFEDLIAALEQRDVKSCEQIPRNHAMLFINQIKDNLYVEVKDTSSFT